MKQSTCCVLLVLLVSAAVVVESADYASTCHKLYAKIAEEQIKKDEKLPPFRWAKLKGHFPSSIHLNFFGAPEMKALRDDFGIWDSNGFTTLWTASILIEAAQLGVIKVDDEQVLLNAVTAVAQYRDKNYASSGRFSFWPQVVEDGVWHAAPTNLNAVITDVEKGGDWIKAILTTLGLGHLWDKVGPVFKEIASMMSAFFIPADFDDSLCALGLGALLKQNQKLFPKSAAFWDTISGEKEQMAVLETLIRYAYQPYSDDLQSNLIDPRSYYWMRSFLETNQGEMKLPVTWILNSNESCAGIKHHYTMPFNLNNIDASVVSNVLFGLTSHFETDPLAVWSPELLELYLNTSAFLAWTLQESPLLSTDASRPDLALLYYPDIYDMLWFVSRTVFSLDSLVADGVALPAPMETARVQLGTAVRESASAWILSQVKKSSDGLLYWEQYLGAADHSLTKKPEPHPEDRLFTTAAALNFLFDSWTAETSSQLEWLPNTPEVVKEMTTKGAQYLNENVFKLPQMNVFFSGSVKGPIQLPFFYPASHIAFVNGSSVPAGTPATSDVVAAMSGVVGPATYDQWLKEKHFGSDVPVNFPGFNMYPFPFWSSPAMTQSLSLLALSKATLLGSN